MSISFWDLLHPQAICLGMKALTYDQIIRQLGAILEEMGFVSKTYIDAVLSREEQFPTGLPLIGDFSVAIPHTDAVHVQKPGIALATLKEPVHFNNMEEPTEHVPVKIVFMLALKDKNAQLDMLQTIAYMLQSPDILSKIYSSQTAHDVLELLNQIEINS